MSWLLVTSAFAQDTDYPTALALENTPLPPADYDAIARRFLLPDTATSSVLQPIEIGASNLFTIYNSNENRTYDVAAQLLVISDHSLLWVEEGIEVDAATAQAFLQQFDTRVAEPAYALWDVSPLETRDENARISLLFTTRVSPQVLGYFASADLPQPANDRELLVFNLNRLSPTGEAALSVAAHEFQHLLQQQLDPDEASWLNEGFALLNEHLLGWPDNQWALNAFFRAPATQLTSFGTGEQINAEYGAALAFSIYLHERLDQDVLRQIAAEPRNSIAGIGTVLAREGLPPVETIYADWVLANAIRDPSLNYGYRNLPDGVEPVALADAVATYPTTLTRTLNQYGSDYYLLDNPPSTLKLDLTMPADAALLPTDANSGAWVWYSQRGDNANPRLTRRFDLRNVDVAELRWHIWYDLERDWDYGYVSVSTDGGETWQLQATELTTTSNAYQRGLGVGYTGQSRGWQADRLALDAFADQEIWIRFEMLTDASVNHPGIALDDIHLDAIGYTSDLEDDGGGWISEGWVRSDNRLPQQIWLQVVQHLRNGDIRVTRWLEAGAATRTLSLEPNATHLTLAVSPFAPMTTEPIAYKITIQ